jgi:hypothetical protein
MENLQNEQTEQQTDLNLGGITEETTMPNILDDAEWCFQFGDEEPVIFAWSNENDTEAVFNLTIPAIEGTAASFKCPTTGKTFNIMVRPMTEETRAARSSMTTSSPESENPAQG